MPVLPSADREWTLYECPLAGDVSSALLGGWSSTNLGCTTDWSSHTFSFWSVPGNCVLTDWTVSRVNIWGSRVVSVSSKSRAGFHRLRTSSVSDCRHNRSSSIGPAKWVRTTFRMACSVLESMVGFLFGSCAIEASSWKQARTTGTLSELLSSCIRKSDVTWCIEAWILEWNQHKEVEQYGGFRTCFLLRCRSRTSKMADDDDDEDCRKRRTTITPTKNEMTSFKIWDSAAETGARSVITVYEVLGAVAGTVDRFTSLQFWTSSPSAIWT